MIATISADIVRSTSMNTEDLIVLRMDSIILQKKQRNTIICEDMLMLCHCQVS